MGKSGSRLRQEGKRSATYTFTGEQLEAHDRAVIEAYKKSREIELKREEAENDRHISNAWKENASAVMSFWLAISCRVLIEQFGWKPPRFTNARKTRLERYGIALVDKINELSHNPRGFRQYSEETREVYGIEFHLDEE